MTGSPLPKPSKRFPNKSALLQRNVNRKQKLSRYSNKDHMKKRGKLDISPLPTNFEKKNHTHIVKNENEETDEKVSSKCSMLHIKFKVL